MEIYLVSIEPLTGVLLTLKVFRLDHAISIYVREHSVQYHTII